jgi:cytochrome c-type biogenesis protein CcmE
MFAKKKFIIGGVIICLGLGYLAYTGFASSATYYYTVSELVSREKPLSGADIRVNGQVAGSSIEKEDGGLTLRFIVTEGGESLPVVYSGVVPDTFKENTDVVIEGRLDSDGVFQAEQILTKCPSKYVPEK